MKSQVWAGHAGGVKFGNQQMDRAGAGLSQLESLVRIFRREDKKLGFLEDIQNALAKRFQIFDDKDNRMNGRLRGQSRYGNLPTCG